jgi:dihydroxyacid dehydratase/phosphogluconate dehydratase
MSEERMSVSDKVNAIMAPLYQRRQEQAEHTLKEICKVVSSDLPPEEMMNRVSLILISHYSHKAD